MKNQDWLHRSLQAVWHPCTQMKRHEQFPLLPIQRAEGMYLYDFEGQAYLDMVSSWWVNLLGHGHPHIRAAIHQQLDTLEHIMLAGFTHQPVVELSERLSALSGLGHAFYGSDGASATEIALKMSVHAWRNQGFSEKTGFVHLENSYHGETLGALSVTDIPLFKTTYAPLLNTTFQAPSPDWRLGDPAVSPEEKAKHAAKALEQLFDKHHTQLAAFIVEPLVQGAAGMGMYHPLYLQEARRLCTEYGIHLIADEIAVGFGRTGTLFAYEQAGIVPDLLCLSKGITGGFLPLAVVLSTDEIYHRFYHDEIERGFLHSHSYTGNPLACAAALATLNVLKEDAIIEKNQEKSRLFTEKLQPIATHKRVEAFRHQGMIWAFEVKEASPTFAQEAFQTGLKTGVLLRPMGNTVYLMPPYILEDAHMVQCVETLNQILSTL